VYLKRNWLLNAHNKTPEQAAAKWTSAWCTCISAARRRAAMELRRASAGKGGQGLDNSNV
jgi:hypothetical protein